MSRTTVFLIGSVLVGLALASSACDEDTTPSVQSLDAQASLSKEGQNCSGTSTGPQCEPGLRCGLYDTPDAGGVCFKP